MEEEKKRLNIIAITDFSLYGEMAVRHGAILAAIFKTSLTIITNFSFDKTHQKNQPLPDPEQETLLLNSMQNYLDHNIETFLLAEHFTAEKIFEFANETNAIMLVIGVEAKGKTTFFNRKKAIKLIKSSRIPVMTVGNKSPDKTIFQQVLLPLDIERQAKEKALWAGYFSRFYCATIHILHPIYKDEFLKKKIKDNIDFIEKLYHNLEITYQIHAIPQAVGNMDAYSLNYADTVNGSLTVIMMTKFYSFADYLIGPKENALIGNPQGFPILCINERDDLYVLCT